MDSQSASPEDLEQPRETILEAKLILKALARELSLNWVISVQIAKFKTIVLFLNLYRF